MIATLMDVATEMALNEIIVFDTNILLKYFLPINQLKFV